MIITFNYKEHSVECDVDYRVSKATIDKDYWEWELDKLEVVSHTVTDLEDGEEDEFTNQELTDYLESGWYSDRNIQELLDDASEAEYWSEN